MFTASMNIYDLCCPVNRAGIPHMDLRNAELTRAHGKMEQKRRP